MALSSCLSSMSTMAVKSPEDAHYLDTDGEHTYVALHFPAGDLTVICDGTDESNNILDDFKNTFPTGSHLVLEFKYQTAVGHCESPAATIGFEINEFRHPRNLGLKSSCRLRTIKWQEKNFSAAELSLFRTQG